MNSLLTRDDLEDDDLALGGGHLVPVQLPMIDTGTLFKNEEEEMDLDSKVKVEEDEIKPTRKSKMLLDSDDDSDDGGQTNKEAATASKVKFKVEAGGPEGAEDKKESVMSTNNLKKAKEPRKDLTFVDLVKAQRGDFMFIQLPDHLPGPAAKNDLDAEQEAPEGDDETEQKRRLGIRDLPEGFLGKIQVRKSGKAQLVLGSNDTRLDVDLGTQVGFLQDVVSINTGTTDSSTQQRNGDLTILGHVRHRLVFTPDWTKLFRDTGSKNKEGAEAEGSGSDDEEDGEEPGGTH